MNIVLEYEMKFPFVLIARWHFLCNSVRGRTDNKGKIYFSDLASRFLSLFYRRDVRDEVACRRLLADYVAFFHVL